MLSPHNIGVVHKGFTVKLGPVVPSVVFKSAQDVVVATMFKRTLKTNQWTYQVREAPQHEHSSGRYASRQDIHDDEERKPLICKIYI